MNPSVGPEQSFAFMPRGHELSKAEVSLLAVFRKFRVGQGDMLCFFGPMLVKHSRALKQLTDQGLLIKERFRGGYALTRAGVIAMRDHDSLGRAPQASGERNSPHPK